MVCDFGSKMIYWVFIRSSMECRRHSIELRSYALRLRASGTPPNNCYTQLKLRIAPQLGLIFYGNI